MNAERDAPWKPKSLTVAAELRNTLSGERVTGDINLMDYKKRGPLKLIPEVTHKDDRSSNTGHQVVSSHLENQNEFLEIPTVHVKRKQRINHN